MNNTVANQNCSGSVQEAGDASASVEGDEQVSAEGVAECTALQARHDTLEAELARLRAAQQTMAHGISHDLRGPLRAIDAAASQLLRMEPDAADGRVQDQAARIRGAVARMASLIDSLLEYQRLGQASPAVAEVDLAFVADWALMDLRDLHPETPIDAEVQPGLVARGDEGLLKALFGKLFDNSRRFADAGRGVRIRVTGERTEAGGLHLSVADHGIGMEMRSPEQPFEAFMRLHGSGQGAGDGLGLAIAKAIVERHGGRIWAVSEVGAGTTIHVLLPQEATDPTR